MPELHMALTSYDVDALICFFIFMALAWVAINKGGAHHGR